MTDLLRPLALLSLAGVMLRLTIMALPPVVPPIQAEFNLHGYDIGVLTAIPPLFFALAALPGAALISRVRAVPSLLAGLVVNAAGAAARGFVGGVTGLELATCVMCLGVALVQPTMPTLARNWMPARIGLASAVSTSRLLCGEVLPVLWPHAPDLPIIGWGRRAVLFQWSVPVLAAAVVIAILGPRPRHRQDQRVARFFSRLDDKERSGRSASCSARSMLATSA